MEEIEGFGISGARVLEQGTGLLDVVSEPGCEGER
jgi:hypothetical protein